MDETKVNPTDQQTPSEKAQPAAEAQSDLAAQLNKFNENVNALLKSVLDPDKRKNIEKQIAASLEQLNKQLSKTIEQVKVEEAVKQARSWVEDAWTTAHGPQILKEMKAGIADTLKAVSSELAKANPIKPGAKDKLAGEGDVKPAEEAKAAVEAVAAKTEAAIDAVAAKAEDIKPPKA